VHVSWYSSAVWWSVLDHLIVVHLLHMTSNHIIITYYVAIQPPCPLILTAVSLNLTHATSSDGFTPHVCLTILISSLDCCSYSHFLSSQVKWRTASYTPPIHHPLQFNPSAVNKDDNYLNLFQSHWILAITATSAHLTYLPNNRSYWPLACSPFYIFIK